MSRKRSIFISRFLDDLGYSEGMVKLRQRHYRQTQIEDIYTLVCGSKREGLTLPFENDVDLMISYPFIECREMYDGSFRNDTRIKVQLERHHTTAPGYTLLKCIALNNSEITEHVRDCLVDVGNGSYLISSDSWKQSIKEHCHSFYSSTGNNGLITQSRDNQGPSCPSEILGLYSADKVDAIPCHCPKLISSWRNRQRLYDWPTPELIETVSSLEAHVVYIGYKDSPLHFLEWRICFTQAEIRLIESLNDCQTKLIILLKMLAKHVLKPVCKEMSSYVMKNLVLWMAEMYPSKTFVEERLLVLLMHALKLLKSCIGNKELPSYMIEERNLFADRISDIECIELCKKLDMLLHEGASMLLRCPKIFDGLNMFTTSPDRFYLFSKHRKFLETIPIFQNMENQLQRVVQFLNNEPCATLHDVFSEILTQSLVECPLQLLIRLIEILLPELLSLNPIDLLDFLGWDISEDNFEDNFGEFLENILTLYFKRLVYYPS